MNVDFLTAIRLFFANYANFKGRSTRAEYWWAALFLVLVNVVLDFIGVSFLSGLWSLAVLLPSLAIWTRRFHDIGKSGWWVVFFCVAQVVFLGVGFGPAMADIATAGISSYDAIYNAFSSHGTSLGIGLIATLALAIWMLVWLLKASGPTNQYGPNPYGEN